MSKIEIPLSSTKLLLGIIASVLFVACGVWIFVALADEQTRFNPTLAKGFGIACVLFFSATAIYAVKKMTDKKIGLTIDDMGITDNTNSVSIGLIKWEDITEIKTQNIASVKFLLIFTKNPDIYFEKAKGVKRKLMEANMNMCRTPIAISSNTLKYNFKELEKLIADRYQNHKK